MSKILIILIAVIVILAGVGWWWVQQDDGLVDDDVNGVGEVQEETEGAGQFLQQPPEALPPQAEEEPVVEQEEATGEEFTVSMTEQGFSPANLTVPAGATVTFINNGELPRHPASDPHPTHDILPGFDSLRGLRTGESYSYTFEQTGRWTYHDHLNTTLTGTIVVE
jgi:plastocyanin